MPGTPSPALAAARARRAAHVRHHGIDSASTLAAGRDLAAQKLEEHIRRVVDAAPPLTQEQRDRLAHLLQGGEAA